MPSSELLLLQHRVTLRVVSRLGASAMLIVSALFLIRQRRRNLKILWRTEPGPAAGASCPGEHGTGGDHRGRSPVHRRDQPGRDPVTRLKTRVGDRAGG